MPGHELILGGEALDVSRGGMRVATTTDLPMGQAIVMRFALPGSDHEMLVRAKIVLSFYDASSQTFMHGIAFTQYASSDYDLLAKFMTDAGCA